jgi:hypothetical protein
MNSSKLAARALTLLPVAVLGVAGFLQFRAQVQRTRAAVDPPAITFLVAAPGHPTLPHRVPRHRVKS